MLYTWLILRLMWSAAIVVYLVLLLLVPARRLRGRDRKLVERLLWLVMLFIAIRYLARFVLLNVWVYQFALVFAGVAAGLGALIQIRALITANPGDNKGEGQSLKLS